MAPYLRWAQCLPRLISYSCYQCFELFGGMSGCGSLGQERFLQFPQSACACQLRFMLRRRAARVGLWHPTCAGRNAFLDLFHIHVTSALNCLEACRAAGVWVRRDSCSFHSRRARASSASCCVGEQLGLGYGTLPALGAMPSSTYFIFMLPVL